MTAVDGVATFSDLTLDHAHSVSYLYVYAGDLPYVDTNTSP